MKLTARDLKNTRELPNHRESCVGIPFQSYRNSTPLLRALVIKFALIDNRILA